MQAYANHAGDSGVAAYAIEARAIVIRFVDGATYRYTERSAGRVRVREMQRLARAGRGLSGYVSREVGDAYAERLD